MAVVFVCMMGGATAKDRVVVVPAHPDDLIPCFGTFLRPETEWVEIVNHGAGIIADADHDRIVAAYRQLADHPVHFPHLFGDGHASEKILQTILDN